MPPAASHADVLVRLYALAFACLAGAVVLLIIGVSGLSRVPRLPRCSGERSSQEEASNHDQTPYYYRPPVHRAFIECQEQCRRELEYEANEGL